MKNKAILPAEPGTGETSDEHSPNRRQLLMRMGLLAGAAYVAPVLLQLSEAHASSGSGNGSGKRGSGKKGSGKSGRRRRRRRRNRRGS